MHFASGVRGKPQATRRPTRIPSGNSRMQRHKKQRRVSQGGDRQNAKQTTMTATRTPRYELKPGYPFCCIFAGMVALLATGKTTVCHSKYSHRMHTMASCSSPSRTAPHRVPGELLSIPRAWNFQSPNSI